MKRFFNLSILGMFLFFMSSCKHPVPDPPISADCTLEGTLVRIPCGISVLDNFWIRMDNGTLYQPCDRIHIAIFPEYHYEGERVRFGFSSDNQVGFCDTTVTCALALPPHQRIKLTCLQSISRPNCDSVGRLYLDTTCQKRYIISSSGRKYEPVNQNLVAPFQDNSPVSFSFQYVCTLVPMCTGGIGVELTCLQSQLQTPVNNRKGVKK